MQEPRRNDSNQKEVTATARSKLNSSLKKSDSTEHASGCRRRVPLTHTPPKRPDKHTGASKLTLVHHQLLQNLPLD